jgi:hypothetical protein
VRKEELHVEYLAVPRESREANKLNLKYYQQHINNLTKLLEATNLREFRLYCSSMNALPPALHAPHPYGMLCPLPSSVFLRSIPPCQRERQTSTTLQHFSVASAGGGWGVSESRIRAADLHKCSLRCNQTAAARAAGKGSGGGA